MNANVARPAYSLSGADLWFNILVRLVLCCRREATSRETTGAVIIAYEDSERVVYSVR